MPSPKKSRKRSQAISYHDLTAKFLRGAAGRRPLPLAATTHTLFCDETGNSGRRFYCPEQPLYAEGGCLPDGYGEIRRRPRQTVVRGPKFAREIRLIFKSAEVTSSRDGSGSYEMT